MWFTLCFHLMPEHVTGCLSHVSIRVVRMVLFRSHMNSDQKGYTHASKTCLSIDTSFYMLYVDEIWKSIILLFARYTMWYAARIQ